MNHRTRVRLLQAGVALVLLLFLSGIAWTLLQSRNAASVEDVPSAVEELAEAARQAEAEQVSTGFEVTRTQEGAVIAVRP